MLARPRHQHTRVSVLAGVLLTVVQSQSLKPVQARVSVLAGVLLTVYLTTLPPPAAALELRDDLQRTISINQPATRIVSLAPHLTELVHSAGAGDKLVGVSRHCDYPPSVAQLPKISDYATINYELLIKLQPDLILVWNAGLKDTHLRKLVSLYDNVYVSNPLGFEDIAENVTEIGLLAGTTTQARQAATTFLQKTSSLNARYAQAPPIKTLYLVWHNPPMTIGGSHWVSQAINLCGGVNVFADAITGIVNLNRESLQLTQADIVLHSLKNYADPKHSTSFSKTLGLTTPSFYIKDDLIQRPSLRFIQGTEQLCRIIHRNHTANTN